MQCRLASMQQLCRCVLLCLASQAFTPGFERLQSAVRSTHPSWVEICFFFLKCSAQDSNLGAEHLLNHLLYGKIGLVTHNMAD